MKLLFITLFLLTGFKGFCQNYPPAFSLAEYAPKLTYQSGTNCYAYAAAYVNLTIQKAYQAQIKNPTDKETFSFGFIDGTIQYLQKLYGKKGFVQLVADSLYEGSAAGINNLDYAFFALHTYGTTSYSKFPYGNAKEIKLFYDPTLLNDSTLVKTSIPIELYNPDSTFTPQVLASFKYYLTKGVPIIISIDQPYPDCNWDDINQYQDNPKDVDGNHIVNIIGYNNTEFIIKNNYEEDCINSYLYSNIFKILRWAYVIQ